MEEPDAIVPMSIAYSTIRFAFLAACSLAVVHADCIASDCTTCLSGKAGATCGWCALNTTTSTAVGPQCVNLHSTFDCDIQFQTDFCAEGWACSHNHTNNASQCVPSVGGISDKQKCEEECSKPPPPPTPPKPTPPSPPMPAFKCDPTTFKCSKAKFGEPSMDTCQQHCKQSYVCNEAAKKCMAVPPNATGQHFYDNATCAKSCPPKPMPVPWELRNIWRGLGTPITRANASFVPHHD